MQKGRRRSPKPCPTQPSNIHDLKQFTETKIILSEKEGRNIKYTLDNELIDEYIHFLHGLKK